MTEALASIAYQGQILYISTLTQFFDYVYKLSVTPAVQYRIGYFIDSKN